MNDLRRIAERTGDAMYRYPEPHVCAVGCDHDSDLMDFAEWLDQPAVREIPDDYSHAAIVQMYEDGWDFDPPATITLDITEVEAAVREMEAMGWTPDFEGAQRIIVAAKRALANITGTEQPTGGSDECEDTRRSVEEMNRNQWENAVAEGRA